MAGGEHRRRAGYASLTGYSTGTGKPFTLVDASGAAQRPVSGQTTQPTLDYVDSNLNFSLAVPGATADLAATASVDPGPAVGQWVVLPDSTPGVSEYRISTEAVEVPAGGAICNAGQAVVEPQPGFAGADGTFTVSVDNEPPSTFAGMFTGDFDSNASNDTTTFAIPAFGS